MLNVDQNAIEVQTSYNRVAGEYARRIFDELDGKPMDRALLDRFARKVHGLGPACDLGCGPGQIARYLHQRGVDVFGIDLSTSMVEQAQQLNPGIPFRQGNMLALDAEDNSWGGIAAFYSIIHIPREKVVQALCELKRVLRPGGLLLLTFHIGQEVLHVDEWWGEQVSVDFYYFQPDEMRRYLEAAGFEIEAIVERAPYQDVEHQSQRAYIFARKPESAG